MEAGRATELCFMVQKKRMRLFRKEAIAFVFSYVLDARWINEAAPPARSPSPEERTRFSCLLRGKAAHRSRRSDFSPISGQAYCHRSSGPKPSFSLSYAFILQPNFPGDEIPGHHEHSRGNLGHQVMQRHLINEKPHQHLVQSQPDDT